jgi:hypothetical protein
METRKQYQKKDQGGLCRAWLSWLNASQKQGANAGDFVHGWLEHVGYEGASGRRDETNQHVLRSQRCVSFLMGYQVAGTVLPLQRLGHFQ